MMHNGGVENFSAIKRQIREPLTDEFYNWIKGQTDSEHIFALLLHYLYQESQSPTADTVVRAFEKVFKQLNHLMKAHGIVEAAYLNMVVTNGLFIVGTRYVTDPKEEPLTLYHSAATHYAVENGVSQMTVSADNDKAILVVSEKLSDDKVWTLIPANHFVIVDQSLQVQVKPIT
jgi:predicted glutamine amidotransferase